MGTVHNIKTEFRLTSASKQLTLLAVVIPTKIQVGYLKLAFFGRNYRLRSTINTRHFFIERFVNYIFLVEEKIFPNHSRPVAILATTTFYDSSNVVKAIIATRLVKKDSGEN